MLAIDRLEQKSGEKLMALVASWLFGVLMHSFRRIRAGLCICRYTRMLEFASNKSGGLGRL